MNLFQIYPVLVLKMFYCFLAKTPVYDIAFALGATGLSRSANFDLQKKLVENIINFPSTADRKYGLVQYGPASIRSRLEHFRDDKSFLETLKGLTLPNSDNADLISLFNLAPDLFRSSASDSNKIFVVFTNSMLPYDVDALESAARVLNRRDIKIVVVNTGDRIDHSSWLPNPLLVVNADSRNLDQRRTVYEIGSMVYKGKCLRPCTSGVGCAKFFLLTMNALKFCLT